MADENDIRPSESDETYIYDQQTAGYQSRARTAAARFRSEQYPSNFEPAPAAPQPDPDPAAEDADTPSAQSNRVGYYDEMSATHRTKTSTEVTRYNGELSDYAAYYNAHIKQPGQSNYQMPVSQVQPLNVTDDGADRPSESNLVSDYDVAMAGYSGISVDSTATTGTRGTTYSQKMASANAKFDALQSTTGENGIKKTFGRLKSYYSDTHNKTNSGETNRARMSVMEAGTSDIGTIRGGMDSMTTSVMGSASNPAVNTVRWLENDIKSRIESMVTNVRNGLITISEYNDMSADMLTYIRQNRTYSRWRTDRASRYSSRFTAEMMQTCWNSTLERYNNQ